MNVGSSTLQRFDYTTPQRRTGSIVEVVQARADRPPQESRQSVKNEHPVLQGEVVGPDWRHSYLRTRGSIFDGKVNRPGDAIRSYQLHQSISPSTVYLPGKLLNAHA